MLIHGDNLLALKALESRFAGKVKCIYIDPPYNTGSAFEHYDDNFEHSTWLNLMRPRLELLRTLLTDDGSIWISIDDDEGHYLKVLCDEVFGRNNFVNTVIWEKKFAPQNDAKWLSDNHDFILLYARNKGIWKSNLLPRTDEMNSRYKNPDNDPRGVWESDNLLRKDEQKSGLYTIITPSGRICNPPTGRSWRVPENHYFEMVADNRIWFGEDGNGVPRIKRFLSEVKQGKTAMTIWKYTEVGHNQEAAKEVRNFNNEHPFTTPKPERLIERILTLGSNPGDLVLDSFLGSGTTAAVALHEGFTYDPDHVMFWKQSKGREKSYLFVTTRHVSKIYLDSIRSTMQENECLLIACRSYDSKIERLYENITVKKISQMLLNRCEFGAENYNLNIKNPPVYDDYEEEDF